METTMVAPRVIRRTPASTLSKLTAATMVIMAGAMTYLQVALIGMFIPPLTIFGVLALISALLMVLGFRWTPILGTLLAGAMLAMFGTHLVDFVAQPAVSLPSFALGAALMPALIIGIISGISATVQNYRRPADARPAPRGLAYGVTAVAAMVVGSIMVAAVPLPGTMVDISPAVLDALPSLKTANFEFDQKEIRVKAGETVTMKLANTDGEAHYLDIDELNVHAPMPSGKTSLAVFKPTQPGTYTFYCHPHADKNATDPEQRGMVGTLIVE